MSGQRDNRVTEKGRGLDCPTPSKTAWRSRKDARRALRAVKSRLQRGRNERVYLCPCGAFHIGGSAYYHRDCSTGMEAA